MCEQFNWSYICFCLSLLTWSIKVLESNTPTILFFMLFLVHYQAQTLSNKPLESFSKLWDYHFFFCNLSRAISQNLQIVYDVEGRRAHWNVRTHVHVMVKRASIVCILLGLPAKTPFSRTAIAWQSGAPGMLYVLQWLTFKITSV